MDYRIALTQVMNQLLCVLRMVGPVQKAYINALMVRVNSTNVEC